MSTTSCDGPRAGAGTTAASLTPALNTLPRLAAACSSVIAISCWGWIIGIPRSDSSCTGRGARGSCTNHHGVLSCGQFHLIRPQSREPIRRFYAVKSQHGAGRARPPACPDPLRSTAEGHAKQHFEGIAMHGRRRVVPHLRLSCCSAHPRPYQEHSLEKQHAGHPVSHADCPHSLWQATTAGVQVRWVQAAIGDSKGPVGPASPSLLIGRFQQLPRHALRPLVITSRRLSSMLA